MRFALLYLTKLFDFILYLLLYLDCLQYLFCSHNLCVGELFGEVLAFVNDPNGLHQLTGLPRGSAEAEIMSILPVYYVFQFLEQTDRWELLGHDKAKSRMELKQKLKEGGCTQDQDHRSWKYVDGGAALATCCSD